MGLGKIHIKSGRQKIVRCHLSGIRCWIVCSGLFFTSALFAGVNVAESIIFDNFSNQVILVKRASDYQVKGTKHTVELSNRLIVETNTNVTKEDIYHYHPQVNKVTELFKGSSTHYYSLTLKDPGKLGQVLNAIRILQQQNEKSGIKLVQPDILQLKTSAEKIALTKYVPPYIRLLDIPLLWSKTKGKGVKVAIIDDGINLTHPDLQHIMPSFSYDVETGELSSSPHPKTDGHGTKVAGIIFAAHNRFGINGIAPEADLIALRQPDTWTSNTLLSFQLAKLAGASIINCSWHSEWLLQPIADAVNELAQYGRDGKGIAVVFAAGNQGLEIKSGGSEAAIDSAIVVGAIGANFKPLGFSNYGQSVDLLTYGSGVKTTAVSGEYGVFAGTSLAAAIVSGLSALVLSQHPEMTLKKLSQELERLTKNKKGL